MLEPRMKNPAMTVPGAMKALVAFGQTAHGVGVPASTLELVHLRASQINGCAVCIGLHVDELRKQGATDERLFLVSAWRESPAFTDAERAALALTEAVTKIADGPDAVSDEVWDQAAKHYSETELAAILVAIAAVNAWNRLNASTRQLAGSVKL